MKLFVFFLMYYSQDLHVFSILPNWVGYASQVTNMMSKVNDIPNCSNGQREKLIKEGE